MRVPEHLNSASFTSLVGEFQMETTHGAEDVGSETVEPYVTAFASGVTTVKVTANAKIESSAFLPKIPCFTMPPEL